MKKKIFAAALAAAMLMSLTACGGGSSTATGTSSASGSSQAEADEADNSEDAADADEDGAADADNEAVIADETAGAGASEDAAADYDRAQWMSAYRDYLTHLHDTGELGDDYVVENDGYNTIEANQFFVADVDGDGREELVINITASPMAGQTTQILDYDPETGIYKESSFFPYYSIYPNGIIWAGVSHNQGYSGDFWPYTIYVYDAAEDVYTATYYVEAWDSSLSETGYDGSAFPREADEDGDGIVYYITEAANEYARGDAIDKDAYDLWFIETTENLSPETFDYYDLTIDSIESLQ